MYGYGTYGTSGGGAPSPTGDIQRMAESGQGGGSYNAGGYPGADDNLMALRGMMGGQKTGGEFAVQEPTPGQGGGSYNAGGAPAAGVRLSDLPLSPWPQMRPGQLPGPLRRVSMKDFMAHTPRSWNPYSNPGYMNSIRNDPRQGVPAGYTPNDPAWTNGIYQPGLRPPGWRS